VEGAHAGRIHFRREDSADHRPRNDASRCEGRLDSIPEGHRYSRGQAWAVAFPVSVLQQEQVSRRRLLFGKAIALSCEPPQRLPVGRGSQE
jgi:hypothetical protein